MARLVDLDTAVDILQNDGIVAFPTETVYGLGAKATSATAIEQVFQAKNRPRDNPLICHFYSIDQIKRYNIDLPLVAELIFRQFAPGPCSLLLNLPLDSPLSAATAGQPKIICRIPDHPLTLALIKKMQVPLVGPSANISGQPSGTNVQMILNTLGTKIDGVLDGGDSTIGVESSILDVTEPKIVKIIRPGVIGSPELATLFNTHHLKIKILNNPATKIVSPGQKYPHYSPNTPILKIQNTDQIDLVTDYVLIATSETIKKYHFRPDLSKNVILVNLGSENDLNGLSKSLYQNLYFIDELQVSIGYLFLECLGSSSLAKAIANRLSKVGQ